MVHKRAIFNQEELGEAVAAPEVPKSPRTTRPRKNLQTMGLVKVSSRFRKLSVAKKGKAITNKLEEDDEALQYLITQIET